MAITAVIQYILKEAQSFGSQDYYSKSLMVILGLAGVLFCENEQCLISIPINATSSKSPLIFEIGLEGSFQEMNTFTSLP